MGFVRPMTWLELSKRHRSISTWTLIASATVLSTINCTSGRREAHKIVGNVTQMPGAVSWQDPDEDAGPDNAGFEAHSKLIGETGPYVSASECAECHPKHYDEWRVSPHAYAQISPVFNAMHATILKRTNGTNGDFCIRCHTPVGMDAGEPLYASNMDRAARSIVSIEGVTCIVCHRVKPKYGKISGRFAIAKEQGGEKIGDIFAPIYGPRGNESFMKAVEDTRNKLKTSPDGPGQIDVHSEVRQADQLTRSGFCGMCHDVTLLNGFRLEEAFSEYKTSPAAARGESCQDCHMGTTPGVATKERFEKEAIAVVLGRPFFKKPGRSDHLFIGPDYSVVHPGIFPHPGPEEYTTRDGELRRTISMKDWLAFDWLAGWGTEEFEEALTDEEADNFPERWDDSGDRVDARAIIDENLELLRDAHQERIQLLRVGFKLGEAIETIRADDGGIRFRIEVKNGTDGHGVPTGFDAERVVFLHVTVTDRNGEPIMQSGDLDPNGDVRDLHSIYVHNHAYALGRNWELDEQLFSLQSKFITRNIRGGEREQVLAVNTSLSPLPFLRPSTSPTILTGQPFGARKHKQNIAPGDSRWANYFVPASELNGNGPYTAEVKLVAGMVPVNLVYEIKEVGFDYRMSPRDVANAVVHGIGAPKNFDPRQFNFDSEFGGFTTLHTRAVTFHVHELPTSGVAGN